MKLIKHESGYILELSDHEINNLNLTLRKCGLYKANFIGATFVLLPHIPEYNIEDQLEWSRDFWKRMSNKVDIDSKDLFHLCIALEYCIIVDKRHAQFICEFRDALIKEIERDVLV